MSRQLMAYGHQLVNDAENADKVIINTCAVTSQAARDARNQTRRIQRGNPESEIFLTGCYATVAPKDLKKLKGNIHIISNNDKNRLGSRLDSRIKHDETLFDREPIMREFLAGTVGNTRAFVKVQDGCDNRCTFCITTIARGSGQSRRLAEVITEIQALSAAGYKEAVLTGVHLGSYGQDLDSETRLFDLVKAILHRTDIPRLRLSSLEPWDLTPDFFTLWQDSRLLPHLHLPLQSGSDDILRRMARRTSRQAFRELVAAAREQIPELNLSTDIILGFPGETEDDFEQTLDYIRELAFSRMHAFTYSPRPGTAAAKMPGQLNKAIKKDRTRRTIELGRELSLAYHQRFTGQTRSVLWETNIGADKNGLRWSGYSDNYIRVTANGPVNLFNSVTPVRLDAAQPDGIIGALIGGSS